MIIEKYSCLIDLWRSPRDNDQTPLPFACSILALSLVFGAPLPVCASPLAGSAQSQQGLSGPCEQAASGGETLDCYLKAAADSRAKVDLVFAQTLRSATDLDGDFNAYVPSTTKFRSSLAADLRKSQKAWLRYAHSQCSFEGGTSFGGSGTDILKAQCHYRQYQLRLAELNAVGELLKR